MTPEACDCGTPHADIHDADCAICCPVCHVRARETDGRGYYYRRCAECEDGERA